MHPTFNTFDKILNTIGDIWKRTFCHSVLLYMAKDMWEMININLNFFLIKTILCGTG